MVGAASLCLVVLLLGSGAPDEQPLSLRCWVVEATSEGRDTPYFDAKAAAVKDALQDLKFDTFRTVREQSDQLTLHQEKKSVLTTHYSMTLVYTGTDDSSRARVVVTVMLAPKTPEDAPRKLVETTLVLSPGGKARVGGLRCENQGEMIIVLARQ